MHDHDTNLSVFQLWLFDNSLTTQKPLRNNTRKHTWINYFTKVKLFPKKQFISHIDWFLTKSNTDSRKIITMHVMNRFFDCFKWEFITIKHIKIVNQLERFVNRRCYFVKHVWNGEFMFFFRRRESRKMAHFQKLDETHPYYAIAAARMSQKPETKPVTVGRFYWKFAAFNFIHKRWIVLFVA